MSEIIKLVKDTKYRGTVTGITPRAGGYNGNNGKWYNCHHLIVEVDQFPAEFFNVQICDLNHDFNLLEVGDYFVFVAGTYKVAEDRYTIKFENKAFKPQSRKETIGAPAQEATVNNLPVHDPNKYTERKLEQTIAGTKWSVCLTAAYNFHKDRNGATDEQVLNTLKSYMRDFNEYQKDEEKYLAHD